MSGLRCHLSFAIPDLPSCAFMAVTPSPFSYKYMKWTLAHAELQGCISSEKLTFIKLYYSDYEIQLYSCIWLLIPVYACHTISVYGNLSHDLTAKLKRIPRPTAVSHASWAWAVNTVIMFPIKLLWKQLNGPSRHNLMIQTEQWYIDVIILEVGKYMW